MISVSFDTTRFSGRICLCGGCVNVDTSNSFYCRRVRCQECNMVSEIIYYQSEEIVLRKWDHLLTSLTDEEKNALAGIKAKKQQSQSHSAYQSINTSVYSRPFPLFGYIPPLPPYTRPPELSFRY